MIPGMMLTIRNSPNLVNIFGRDTESISPTRPSPDLVIVVKFTGSCKYIIFGGTRSRRSKIGIYVIIIFKIYNSRIKRHDP